MSKEQILGLIEENWEDALLRFYNVKKKDEAYFLDDISSFEAFDSRDFSDYAETIRMPMDTCTLEIHSDFSATIGHVYLLAPYGDEEEIIYQCKYSKRSKKSLNKAIQGALMAYFEYKRDVYESKEEY